MIFYVVSLINFGSAVTTVAKSGNANPVPKSPAPLFRPARPKFCSKSWYLFLHGASKRIESFTEEEIVLYHAREKFIAQYRNICDQRLTVSLREPVIVISAI